MIPNNSPCIQLLKRLKSSPMDIETRYQETLDYIYRFIDNSLTHQADPSLENADLSRMVALMDKLGNPQNAFPSIHVAGSKGKGSVSAFCASALGFQGYKVGLYTSPHLQDFEERIQINQHNIPRGDFIRIVDDLKPMIHSIPGLNTFEIATALAFMYFREEQVDIAVIEVGLGGRLDATNVITPLVSVITALFLEHTKILGDTLTKIAFEKGGIIKNETPIILSPQREEALATIQEIVQEKSAPFTLVGRDFTYSCRSTSLENQQLSILNKISGVNVDLEIGLLGQHQLENATTAYATLQILRGQGVEISETAIRSGFANVNWPARFEILNLDPPVVVDSAHNPDSARRIRETLEEYFPGKPVVIVFGVSDDKDISGIISALIPGAIEIICSQSTHPRAMDANKLKDKIAIDDILVKVILPIGKALDEAIEAAQNGAVVIVIGSIFVAATARIAWFEKLYRAS